MAHLPISQIIDATYNDAHFNHVHVSGAPYKTGEPPLDYPGWTKAIKDIYDALEMHYGRGAYFMDVDHHWEGGRYVLDDPNIQWTHMGIYNRRRINNDPTKPWSQHAYANGLDIGPYYGIDAQRPFIDFLERSDHVIIGDMFTADEVQTLKDIVASLKSVGSNGYAMEQMVKLVRKEREFPLHRAEAAVVLPHKHTVSVDFDSISGTPI